MEDLRWAELGHERGLSSALVSESSMLGWSFASFRRELAEPVTPDVKARCSAPNELATLIDDAVAIVASLASGASVAPYR